MAAAWRPPSSSVARHCRLRGRCARFESAAQDSPINASIARIAQATLDKHVRDCVTHMVEKRLVR
jgi:hypothetical protein